MECHSDEIQGGLMSRTEDVQSPSPDSGGANLYLHEAGGCAWNRLFEELQRVIIVQNFDGVCQRKKMGMDKVVKMIDEMVVTLKQEQKDDDTKKLYCADEFDKSDDKKKALERSIGDLDKAIEESKEQVTTLSEEIKDLEEGIVKLDREVAQATEIRKKEHADYEAELAAQSAAVKLIEFAKNRMQKFYNPKLYKPPPKRELTEEERITLNMGGTLAPTNPPGGIAGQESLPRSALLLRRHHHQRRLSVERRAKNLVVYLP
jgi:hypothetical protein